MSHRRIASRPLSSVLALSLTGGTLAALGAVVTAAPASATVTPVCNQPTQTFAAGASGTYTVPAGATTVSVVASGAAAVNGAYGSGGSGATLTTSLSVTPGEILDYTVGTRGTVSAGGLSGTAVSGGSSTPYYSTYYGSGGGGGTFIRNQGTLLVAAGGGGGAGIYVNGGSAGPATAATTSGVFAGGNGAVYQTGSSPATGGSATVGLGAGAGHTSVGFNGSGTVGGDGGTGSGSGGGGGGYMGGGGGTYGAIYPSSGGAGSSYVAGNYTIGANSGAGSLTISAPADPIFQSASSTVFVQSPSDTFQVCAPGGPGTTMSVAGTLPNGVTFMDNHNGTATLSGKATQLGDFPLTFTSISSVATETQPFTLTVHDITAKTLSVTATPVNDTAGNNVSVTVTAYDAQGAVATTDQDPIDLSSSDGAADWPNVALHNGTATFYGQLYTTGTQTFTASDTTTEGVITGTSNNVTVAPAATAAYSVVLATSANAGQQLAAVITALDVWGNVNTNDNGVVDLSSTDGNATLQSTGTLVNGVLTVPVTFATTGGQTMTATDDDTGSLTGTSSPVTVSAAATHTLLLDTPANDTAGAPLWAEVQAKDAYGNDTNPSDVLHFSSTDPQAVLPADATWLSVTGNFTVTWKTAGNQTLTVTDVTHPGVVAATANVSVVAGIAQHLGTKTGDAQSAPAGHAFGTRLTALVTDANGNPVAGQQVTFALPSDSDASFGGHSSVVVVSDSNGVAAAGTLTAGATLGTITVTATSTTGLLIQPGGGLSAIPAARGATTFSETVTASDAVMSAVAKSSTGVGTNTQSVTVTMPAGGSITLLDGSNQPVSQLATPDGTYVLDPSTGVISFAPAAGFVGTPAPVIYRLTDAYNLQATGTYAPVVTAPPAVTPPVTPPVTPVVVHPMGTAHVRTSARMVLGNGNVPATCTVSVASIKSCRTTITAHVSGRQVVLGTSTTVKAKTGAKSVTTVVRLNALGRGLAAQIGGTQVTVWASVVKADGRKLSAKTAASIVDKRVVVAAPVLFPTKGTALSAKAKHDLKAVKAHLGAVKTVTCVGYTDALGDSAANIALGRARAEAVCAALAKHGVKVVVVTHGDAHPAGDNATAAGRALNRRVEVTLSY